jgi:hypothetical protein
MALEGHNLNSYRSENLRPHIFLCILLHMYKVKLSLCSTNESLRHEDVWGSGCTDPRFLDLGTSCRWVVTVTPQPLYPRGKCPRYLLDRRLGGPQSRSGQRGNEKIWLYRDSNSDPSLVQPVASGYTDCATTIIIVWTKLDFYSTLYSGRG